MKSERGLLGALRLLRQSPTFGSATRDVLPLVVGAAVTLVFSTAAGLVAIDYQARLLGTLEPGSSFSNHVWMLFWVFVATQLMFEILQFLRRVYQNKIVTRMSEFLKLRIFQKMTQLGYLEMQRENQGNVTQLFSADSVQVGSIWAEGVLSFITTLVMASGVSIFLVYKMGWPGMAFLVVLIMLLALAQKFSRLSAPVMRARAEYSGQRLAEIQESVRGMATLKMLGAEETFLNRVLKFTGLESKMRIENSFIACRYIPLFASLRWVGWALIVCWVVFVFGSPERFASDPTAAATMVSLIFAVNWYSSLLQEPFLMVGAYLNFIQVGSVSVARLDEFLERPVQPREFAMPTRPEHLVTLSGATFGYTPQLANAALASVDLSFAGGEFVVVVGRVGSGKSTLVRALLGELVPLEGTMHRNPHLRVAFLGQEPFLHSATLRDTLRFEFENRTEEDAHLNALLEEAQFRQDLLTLEQGLETSVGERGVNLSGGQKQRVSLARVAYFDSADLILLDDPLSALDRTTAVHITRSLLLGRWAGKAIVLTTHRLEVAQHAHRILVLEEGRVVQQGTHAELLQISPVYQELYRKSMLG